MKSGLPGTVSTWILDGLVFRPLSTAPPPRRAPKVHRCLTCRAPFPGKQGQRYCTRLCRPAAVKRLLRGRTQAERDADVAQYQEWRRLGICTSCGTRRTSGSARCGSCALTLSHRRRRAQA